MKILVESIHHFTVRDCFNVRIWVQEDNDAAHGSKLKNMVPFIDHIKKALAVLPEFPDELRTAQVILEFLPECNAVEVLQFGPNTSGVVLYRDWP